jgi:chemotaxis family two-component system response regulator PixG
MVAADFSAGDTPSGLLGIQSRLHFTGRLDVRVGGQQWSLYFYMGRLIWATGGPHAVRRWYRYLGLHCPKINLQSLQSCINPKMGQCWDYQLLTTLVKQEQVTVEQAVALIRSIVSEVLFDVLQQEETKLVSFKCDEHDVLDTSLALVNAQQTLEEIQRSWHEWRALGLVDHSPDLAPVLRQQEQLQQQAPEKVYKTLVSLIDGKRSLRDLAVRTKQELVQLTRMLVPYFRKGFIGFAQIPDLPSPTVKAQPTQGVAKTPTPAVKTVNSPLIAYIDDSKRECDLMNQIVTRAGYQFVGLQDSVQALTLLLERRPNLIFLDLVMPVAGGYEICAQLRRVSLFKETPIVILTNNDGIIDRVRAKAVGCTEFISKPIEADKVLEIAQKYAPI